jgi:DNA polymerase-3 subunit delta'
MMQALYPWQHEHWQQLMLAWQQNRLHHALLLCGRAGMGKLHFAEQFAASLLCEHPSAEGFACEHCKPCHLRKAGNHPDLLHVQPAEAGKMIQVDQIRQLLQACNLTANYSGYQVIILQPAEAMNNNAANSLLKLLEEPPAKTAFLLVSHQPMALPATVRSRCQRIDFNRAAHDTMRQWLQTAAPAQSDVDLLLKLTQYAPLSAHALITGEGFAKRQQLWQSLTQLLLEKADPVQIAMQWDKLEAKNVLGWIQSWTMDFIRFRITSQVQWIVNQDFRDSIQRLAAQMPLAELFKLLEQQQAAFSLLQGSSNVKSQGILENLAIAWQRASQVTRRA